MMRRLTCLIALCTLAIAPTGTAQSTAPVRFVGNWEGALQAGLARLRLGLIVERDAAGTLTGVMTSLDQGNAKLPATLTTSGDTLTLLIAVANARFRAVINGTGDSLIGTFVQGTEYPLTMHRVATLGTTARPQDPKPPFPYRTTDVEFESVPGVRIAGTVITPAGAGPFPAVVFVTGSGPQNRDEELMGHKPFLVIADYLARHGIASLRTDDRGIGKSTGNFGASTSADFANDAEAALRFLRGTAGIDPKRVGIIGHSEGGLIAPMIAARNKDVAFLVLLAGPGVPGDSILILQSRLLAKAAGAPEADLERAARFNRRVYDIVKSGADSADASARLRSEASALASELRPAGAADSTIVRTIMQQTAPMLSPWYRYFITHDPRPDLRRVRVPVLALNGTLDLQVPYRENLGAIAAALKEAGNRDVETVEFPNLNHLFQPATTGAVSEYSSIETTVSPQVLEKIVSWINQRSIRK